MASYNWRDYPGESLWERYLEATALSEGARAALGNARRYGERYLGRARELAREIEQPEPDALAFILELLLDARTDPRQTHLAPVFQDQGAFDGLIALRASSSWGEENSHLQCPRIFISHRQRDYAEALRIAKIATEEGFQFWLDILDPTLAWLTTVGPQTLSSRKYQLFIAVIIEMALLHCSHVIAVMTPHTAGSAWVPYEYGRVKDSSVHSLQAGCWVHPGLGGLPWEYLLLGAETRRELDIRRWLARERSGGSHRYGSLNCAGVASNDWRDEWGEPAVLPGG